MKIYHLNYSDSSGGAARAAYRIHKAVLASGHDSQLLVNQSSSGDFSVQGPHSKRHKALVAIRHQVSLRLKLTLQTTNAILHSPSILPSQWPAHINSSDVNVAHLHWVQHEMLSVADIGRIKMPLVWTLHDMWAFCGAEHLSSDNRFRDGYLSSNRPCFETGFDLNRWTWQRKKKYWKRPIHIVCPSLWLAECVKSSALMRGWRVSIVPNPIDTCIWKPVDKRLARKLLHLPHDANILLFGANGASPAYHKGFDLLLKAIAHLNSSENLQNFFLLIFGQSEPKHPPKLPYPFRFTGHLHDDLSLRILYSAADVLVIPSRQDNFPNTGIEAQACGTPVVAFNTCGLPDIVKDRVTGALANPFDPSSLASAIQWLFSDPQRLTELGVNSRYRAIQLWAPARIASLYEDIYLEATEVV